MGPGDPKRVANVFGAARALPPDQRRDYVERECSDDPALGAEVLDLLEQDRLASGEGFLASVMPPDRDTTPSRPEPTTRVRIILGSGTRHTVDFVPLFRAFLRAAAAIAFIIYAISFFLDCWKGTYPGGLRSPVLSFHLAAVLISGVASAIVWSKWPLNLPWLRAIEFSLLLASVVYLSLYEDHELCNRGSWPPGTDELQSDFVNALGDSCAIRWFAVIVLYGIFSPNTRWRCAMNSIAIALFPLGVAAAAALRDPEPAWFVVTLSDMCIFVSLACAIAICGSIKIARLQEAEEASRVGEFRRGRRLGSGGMGEVYLAFQPFMSRPCALKLIRPDCAGERTTLEQFSLEVRQASQLMHRNNIRVYYSGQTEDGTFYYTMEYLPGLTFQKLVEAHGPPPPERVIYLLRQVCDALREAHSRNMIHRDIKPTNLMLCQLGGEPDVVKVLDYGLVQDLSRPESDDGPAHPFAAGTPAYMSPEQATGRSALDVRSDVYSVGAVGLFLLAGRPPRDGRSALGPFRESEPRPVPRSHGSQPEVPADLEAVIARCLEQEPARRFPDVMSLAIALSRCDCARLWDASRAAEWWRENPAEDLSAPAATPGLADGTSR